MFVGTFSNFTNCYFELVRRTYFNYSYESAPRGQKIRECLGVSFTITNPRARYPYVHGRKFSTTYLIAELLWYLSGNNKTEWIGRYSGFWKNISDDGVTANSAYGARLFQPHERIAGGELNQWNFIVNELKNDPDSRRAVMHIRVPEDSVKAKLDVPCTLALQFFIRDRKLHQVVHMRSSDVIFGIAYDIPAFTMFQEILANELGVGLGDYTHVSNSLHIYERHFGMAETILNPENRIASHAYARNTLDFPVLKENSLEQIRCDVIPLLLRHEEQLRKCQSANEINNVLISTSLSTYWQDWLKILAVKRLRELGCKQLAKDKIKQTNSRAYHFYSR